MFAFVVAALVAAPPQPSTQPSPPASPQAPTASAAMPAKKSVLVLDLVATDVPQGAPRLLSGLLTDDVAKHTGFRTLSQEDIRRVVALEADKRDAGCSDSSCLAELANAMGVDYVVFGDVGKLGNAYVVTLRLFDSKRAEAIARETEQASDIDGLRTNLDDAVARLVAPVAAGVSVQASAPSSPPPNALVVSGVVVGSVGALVAVGGGIYGTILDGSLGDPKATSDVKANALDVEPWVWIGATAGVAAAVIGAGMVVGGEL